MSGQRGTVMIIADSPELAAAEAETRNLNHEDTRRALYVAADGSTVNHSLSIRRPLTYVNMTGREMIEPVSNLITWLRAEKEEG